MADNRKLPSKNSVLEQHDLEGLRDCLVSFINDFSKEIMEFDREPVHGRIYPASSIEYQSGKGLVQRTSSPGYWGDVWSLTCCKHDMRKSKFYSEYMREIADGVYRPSEPLLIYTTASITGSDPLTDWEEGRKQWLASVALVTYAFEGMEAYGEYLIEQDEQAWRDRITTQDARSAPEWALQHGDCHAEIDDGEIVGTGTPYHGHDHVGDTVSDDCGTRVPGDGWHAFEQLDNKREYLKFVSCPGYWLSWSEPSYYRRGSRRSRWGGGQDKIAFDYDDLSQGDGTVLGELSEVI